MFASTPSGAILKLRHYIQCRGVAIDCLIRNGKRYKIGTICPLTYVNVGGIHGANANKPIVTVGFFRGSLIEFARSANRFPNSRDNGNIGDRGGYTT